MMRHKIEKRRRSKNGSYTKMLRSLLLQNQQIIIQQQNMMFMVMKQFQQPSNQQQPQVQSQPNQISPPMPMQHSSQPQPTKSSSPTPLATATSSSTSQPQTSSSASTTVSHNNSSHHHQHHHQQQQHHLQILEGHPTDLHSQSSLNQQIFSQLIASETNVTMESQQAMQQVTNSIHSDMGHYLTPAASEQDPISDNKQDEDDLAALYEDDGMLQDNMLYNPQTDIGPITPYKSLTQQQQTPSYYSSGCESLSTPRVEQQSRAPATANINHNVVKNLADSFKSPSKPKINIKFLSGSATSDMKNSKAKIIQRMNIPQFLRTVHQDGDTN